MRSGVSRGMGRRVMARILLLAFVALAACSTTMRQSFDETAALFHDDLRWGRLPTAEGAVDPAIRAAFTQRHRPWGVTVQIMDVEVESMRANADRGTVRLRVMWTRGTDSTEIRESVIEEAWETGAAGWRLRNEAIILSLIHI